MLIDFGRGWQQIARPVTLGLTRPAGVEPELTVSVPNCHKAASEKGALEADELTTLARELGTFTLWDSQTTLRPERDFFVTEQDGTRWRILRVDVCGHGSRFRCHAIRSRNA